ncbi:MAG: hypothetical protein JOZ75_12605 [Candidatus Dormibacteraeota bacterium]|nr:hypothetical protein [Candidatus Dormibacteraeota bacterium]
MSGELLSSDELRFINLVAVRRVGGRPEEVPAAPEVALADLQSERPVRRAARLGAALTRPGAVAHAALPTALLAVICQLNRDGYRLVAPQGAAAGMIRGLSTGGVSVDGFAAWVEDRAIAD